MLSKKSQKKLTLFLLLTATLSTVFYALIVNAGTMQANNGIYIIGLMWSPGVAALVSQLITEKTLRGLGWRWGKTRDQLLSIGLPLILIALVYGAVWLTGLGGVPDPDFVDEVAATIDFETSRTQAILIYVLTSAAFGLVTTSVTALGEEIGWRGLLVPELRKVTTFNRTALISGAIWALWHYPGILFADYHSEAPIWYALICFTVMAISFSVILAWIRLKTGSVWTSMFLHASHNVFIQTIFNPLTLDTGSTEYVIGEFGAGMTLVYLVAALVFWQMRHRLPGMSKQSAGTDASASDGLVGRAGEILSA